MLGLVCQMATSCFAAYLAMVGELYGDNTRVRDDDGERKPICHDL